MFSWSQIRELVYLRLRLKWTVGGSYEIYSLVLLMMCSVSGLIPGGSFSSAWIKGISSPVSRFLIITLARISCITNTHGLLPWVINHYNRFITSQRQKTAAGHVKYNQAKASPKRNEWNHSRPPNVVIITHIPAFQLISYNYLET